MSKVSISQAIKMSGKSRSHFYDKYVNTGRISVTTEDGKKYIDTSELIRVFGSIQPADNIELSSSIGNDTIKTLENIKIIELLENQLREAQAREQEAKKREEWLQLQIEELRKQQSILLEDKTLKKRKKFLGIF